MTCSFGSVARGAALAAALLLGGAGSARAEVFELLDGTKVSGKLTHFFEGVFVIEAGGASMQLPRDKVRAITFKLPPPRAELSTPEKTFNLWKTAVLKADVARIIDCYALMYQGFLAAQLVGDPDRPNEEGLRKFKQEVEGTRFTVKSVSIKGDRATLKVVREHDGDVQTGEIPFVRENGEWKMVFEM